MLAGDVIERIEVHIVVTSSRQLEPAFFSKTLVLLDRRAQKTALSTSLRVSITVNLEVRLFANVD